MAGVFFGFGTQQYFTAGALSYLLCNILDCADGQIARLKKNGTKVGRIIDGFIDYVVSTAIYIGIGIGLTKLISHSYIPEIGSIIFNFENQSASIFYIWTITALGGFSSAFQAIYFDYYRNEFLEKVYGKFSSIEEEIKEFEEEQYRLNKAKSLANLIDRILIAIYLKYCALQLSLKNKQAKKKFDLGNVSAETYSSKHKLPLRLCSLMGSTTHMTLCFIFAIIGNFEIYLLICFLPLNILMTLLYFTQLYINKKLSLSNKSVV